MSINVQVSPIPNINILVGNSGNLLNLSPQGYTLHSNTHISGGIDAINHNFLLGLQGGQSNQYYHLNSGQYVNLNNIIGSTGNYILRSETGAFYAASNPSGFITGINNIVYDFGNQNISGIKNFYFRPTVNGSGVLLNGESLSIEVAENISGLLQNQITILNNQTGDYTLHSETGAFYAASNPNNYTTKSYVDIADSIQSSGITNLNNNTGNYVLKNNTGQFLTTGAADNRYVDFVSNQIIYGNKTFSNDVYINHLYVTGSETLVNTYNSNVQSPYLLLNLTGGATDGGIFFVTGSGLTGIYDEGPIIGFDHSNKFVFGVSARDNDLSSLNHIASEELVIGLSGYLQPQIINLNNKTGDYYLKSNPSGFITGIDLTSYATTTYVTGVSGNLQSQITNLNNNTGNYTLNSQTGQFYSSFNPSGYITGINNLVYTTGNQNISGNININGNLTISGIYDIYGEIEKAKILSIAYAIAL